eukprot:14516924-Alexandrium_andersonii.AAC.1
MDFEANVRPRDGRSAFAGGTRTGFSDSVNSGGCWSECSDGGGPCADRARVPRRHYGSSSASGA